MLSFFAKITKTFDASNVFNQNLFDTSNVFDRNLFDASNVLVMATADSGYRSGWIQDKLCVK